jgi:predicted RNA-binding Zn-ribbon protein involved in translation (DUF1610 family)
MLSYRKTAVLRSAAAMFQIVPDKWYFTVVCRKCGERFAFLDSASPANEIAGGGLRIPQNVGCPMCGHEALYRPDEVQVRQAHTCGFSDE